MEKETWKDLEHQISYQVSSYGRIRNVGFKKEVKSAWGGVCIRKYNPKIIKDYRGGSGYRQVRFKMGEQNQYVHRLVALAFIPNPHNKKEVNHIDGDKSNNAIDNLEWVSSSENHKHSTHILGNISGQFSKGRLRNE